MMEVRQSDRDGAFLRRFLTHELMRELDLFTWKVRGEHLVVDEVSDEDHWENVRSALLRQVGVGSFPVIRVVDSNFKNRRGLYLTHEHDGRDLEMTAADKTLGHLRSLWGHDVFLLTQVRGKKTMLSSTDNGFDAKLVS
jgi:stage V sporulation protein R